jgi:SAM-dependent MidA family methyltransferase
VDVGRGEMPERFRGVVFANEFFDALPVDVTVRRADGFHEMRVGWQNEQFCWMEGGAVSAEAAAYLAKYADTDEDGALREVNLEALRWLERIAQHLECGYVLAIDYGYTTRELVRFPQGTLMSYRRHVASEDVLREPGERDITAHVHFSALEAHAALHGLNREVFETLSLALLRAGEKDNFATVIEVGNEAERVRRRLQLKTLLYGMGETFRTLLLKKACTK